LGGLHRAGTDGVEKGFDPQSTEAEWLTLAGFERLRTLLDRHFIRRARFLRCYRIVNDCRKIFNDVRFNHLPDRRRHDRRQKAKFDGFLQFVRGVGSDSVVAKELEVFLVEQCQLRPGSEVIESELTGLDRRLAEFVHEVEELNAEFEALQILEDNESSFSEDELEELRRLFGLYGLETTERVRGTMDAVDLGRRQQSWVRKSHADMIARRRLVAEFAITCYGRLLSRITEEASQNP
jgi:hypothetical protein